MPVAGDDLKAMAAYLASLRSVGTAPGRNPDGSHSTAALRGQQIFFDQSCDQCHNGSAFTDSGRQGLLSGVHDIGTLELTSGSRLGEALLGIDTPTLRGLWLTAPYLHDGRALTLHDAVLAHDGVAMPAQDLDDLVAYLLEIDDDERPATAVPLPGRSIGLLLALTALVTVWRRAKVLAAGGGWR